MNKILKVILTFLFLLNLCLSDRIIPDPDFPILVKSPIKGVDNVVTKFEFRFKLPTRTSSSSVNPASGIGFNQFIGVRFNDGLFSFTTLFPSCTLTSATTSYLVEAVQPTSSSLATTSITDTKVIYCKLVDSTNTKLPGDTTLTLSINFSTKISSSWIHNISVFTSTSNNPDQLIIDNLPTFGSVGLYSDYTTSNNNKLLQISNGGGSSLATVTSPSNSLTNTLYPGFTFDTRLVVQVMQYWMVDPEDFIVYLKYDTTCFLPPTAVTTEDVSTNSNELKLASTLQLVSQSDGAIITGFTNGELYPNRKFKLVIGGMRATDSKLEVATQIELLVYYKNTYSIVSYANINMDIVKMISLTATVNHPEYFYMYDGMGWPFLFTITSPVDIANGGFVVIRHKNKSVETNNLNFVASTCDFSTGTQSIDQGFGKMNICRPLRNDFNHDTTTGLESSTNNEGSGIYFKLNQITSAVKYSVKVWAFIEKCIGDGSTANIAKNYAATLTFTIRIYKKAFNNDSYLNEKIFFDTATNYILARNTAVVLTENCFHLQTRTDYITTDSLTPTIDAATLSPLVNKIPLSRIKWTTATTDLDDPITYDYNLPIGIELHNLSIIKPASTSDLIAAAKNPTLFFNYSNGKALTDTPSNSNLALKYLYGSTSSELGSTNVTFFALYQANLATVEVNDTELDLDVLNTYNFQDYIPNECASYYINDYITKDSTITQPRLQWLFSRDFLTPSSNAISSTTGCQVSWLLVDDYNRTSSCTNKTLFYGSGVSVGVNKNLTTITSAAITPVTGSSVSKNMSETNSQILSTYTSADGITFKITSEAMITTSNSVDTRTLSMTGLNCYNKMRPPKQPTAFTNASSFYNTGTIGVHTNCLSWKSSAASTSMFAYFEAQHVLLHNLKYPARVWRFIKLYPEPGFFQDPSDLDTIPTGDKVLGLDEKWIVGHYEATTSSAAPFSVCLIEISARIVNEYKTTSSNTLVIWLFATSLLDTDVNDSSSQYPVAPVSDTAYGLNSGQTISLGNRRISDIQNWNGITDGSNYPNLSLGHVGELEMTFYQQILSATYVNQTAGSQFPLPGFKSRRTMYQFFLGSVIYIPTSSDNITGSDSTNIYIPFLCPSYADSTYATAYPSNGVYFVAPIVTVAWANMSAYNNISKIESYINPGIHASTAVDGTGGTTFQLYSGLLLTVTSHNAVGTFGPAGGNKILPVQTPLFKSGAGAAAVAFNTANPKVNSAISTRSLSFATAYFKASFNPYNNSLDKQLTLKLVTDTAGETRTASALSLFLNADIGTLNTSVTGDFPITSNTDNTLKVKALNSKVYVMGKPFTRFLAYAIVRASGIMSNFPNNSESNYSIFTITTSILINGIPRLDISKYNSNGKINPLNYVAVFTSSSIIPTTYGNMLTNLRVYDTSSFSTFLLWHPDIRYDQWYAVLSLDNTEDTIKDDKGGNLKIVGSVPTNIPVGSELTITISSNVLASSVSLCGLIENGLTNAVTNCSISGADLTCKLSKLTKNFEVCCYNIVNNNTQISATQGYVTLPYDTTILTSNILTYTSETFDTIWYKYPETTSGTAKLTNEYNFANRVLPDITVSGSSFHVKLNNVIYSYTSTSGGFGKALFEIVFPRSIVRGMSLNVKIDLSSLSIPNFKPKIIPTFGNSNLYGSSLDSGDIFLDSVYSNLDTNGIKLKLKNILYKCGLELSRNLNIFIWPVKVANLTKAAVTIEMKGPDSNNLAAPFAHTVTSTPQDLQDTLVDNGISTDFMSISSITPKIVDEYTEYTFTFNFSSFATNLENKTVNEIFIFFPYEYYDHNELLCYNGTSRLTCNFMETAMLSIRLGSALTINSDSKIAIRLVGVINPYIGTNSGIYFACSVNNTNFRTGERTTLIRGTATINEGTLPSNNDVSFGSLVFKNEFNTMSFTVLGSTNANQGQAVFNEEPLNPRDDPSLVNATYTSLHQFGLTFDIANNFISGWENGYTMQTPNLYITFPKQYRFEQRTFTPTVKVEAFFMDQTDNTLITETENFTTASSVTVVGNQLRVTFSQTSWTFSKYFQYFKIKVYGVHPPSDNTIGGISTTEGIKFTLFNNERTVIFRTWPNLFNFSKYDIGSQRISDLLPQNKGFKYEYDNTRWIIDLIDKVKNKINEISLPIGRYSTFYLTVRTNSKFITPATAEIGLESGIIEFDKIYRISTASFNDVAIRVGVACNVDLGDVIIFPKIMSANVSSIYNTFLPLAPVRVSLIYRPELANIISVPSVINVRRGGSTFITYTLSQPTFSDLAISFDKTTGSESEIDSVTIKKGKSTARTTFRMLDSNTDFTQGFITGNVNDCTKFEHERLAFRINSDVAIIPNDALVPTNFSYYNSSTDNTLLGNQIKFVMTTIYTEIYVYAALTCLDKDFPTDLEIRSQNVTTSNTLAYFSDIITNVADNKSNTNNNQNSFNLVFSNLVRGQRFKLRVIIESTQSNTTLRTYSTITLSNYTASNGSIDYFIATKSVTPICTSYRFVTRPGIQVTNPLLFYWQSKFSSAGYYETGCVTAVDQYGTSASGLPSIVNETNCGTANCRFIDRNNYVVNQTSLNVSETYTICAYPLSYCDTDPANYEEIYTDILNTLPTNTSFPAVLNTLVVPAFTITRISDGSAPSTPSVSNVKVTGSRMTFDAKSGSPITCFIKSAAPGKAYTSADFESCGTGCLVVDLTTESESFSVNVDTSGVNNSNNSTAACSETSTNYKIYGVCFNSAPCSNLKTNVLDLGTGILSSKTGNCTSDQSGNNTNTPSTFVTMNMMIFFILALILLA